MLSSQVKIIDIVILSILLLGFSILTIISILRLISAKYHQAQFIFIFFLVVILNCAIYYGFIIYQLVQIIKNQNPSVCIIALINIFTFICLSSLVLMVTRYWKQTNSIFNIPESKIIFKGMKKQRSFITVWTILYSIYFICMIIFSTQQNYTLILYMIFVTGSSLLILYSVILQLYYGYKLSRTLKNLETIIDFSLNKTKFRILHWVTPICNVGCLGLVIAIHVIQKDKQNKQYLEITPYLFSSHFLGLLVLFLYLLCFKPVEKRCLISENNILSDNPSPNKQYQSLFPYKQNNNNDSSRSSKQQTELSSSYGDQKKKNQTNNQKNNL